MSNTIKPSIPYYPYNKTGQYQPHNDSTANSRQLFAQKLIAAGIPEATVFQGAQAVEAYITANHIDKRTLPPPPSEQAFNTGSGFKSINLNKSNVLPTGGGRILNFNA